MAVLGPVLCHGRYMTDRGVHLFVFPEAATSAAEGAAPMSGAKLDER